MKSAVAKKSMIALLILIFVLVAVFLAGRYGWKLFGFSVCDSVGIEQISVVGEYVHIRGFYPGSFPRGFLGYYAEQVGNTLYVGFRFSGPFGIFETGDFDVFVPTKGTVSQVIIKTRNDEYPLWSAEDSFT